MLTQKDIHNFLVEHMSVQQKIDISMRCGNDPKKIEKVRENCSGIMQYDLRCWPRVFEQKDIITKRPAGTNPQQNVCLG